MQQSATRRPTGTGIKIDRPHCTRTTNAQAADEMTANAQAAAEMPANAQAAAEIPEAAMRAFVAKDPDKEERRTTNAQAAAEMTANAQAAAEIPANAQAAFVAKTDIVEVVCRRRSSLSGSFATTALIAASGISAAA